MVAINGGKRLERKLAELAAELSQYGTVRVGFLRNAKYPDGTPVALIAAIQNYGAPKAGIPPRPFFTNMIVAKSPEWPAAIKNLLLANNYNVRKTLDMTGAAIKGQLQQSIRDTNAPPLAPVTIRRKGFAKPLIETGHMLNSVDYEVDIA